MQTNTFTWKLYCIYIYILAFIFSTNALKGTDLPDEASEDGVYEHGESHVLAHTLPVNAILLNDIVADGHRIGQVVKGLHYLLVATRT